jgi:hypothetical protein
MFRNASTRVRERSMIRVLKASKVRQPETPASTTVVVPAGRTASSGKSVAARPPT